MYLMNANSSLMGVVLGSHRLFQKAPSRMDARQDAAETRSVVPSLTFIQPVVFNIHSSTDFKIVSLNDLFKPTNL